MADHGTHPRDTRARLAGEAARLMAEKAIDDPLEARRKAVAQLDHAKPRDLPTGEEVVAALRDHLALFQAETHRQRLLRLRTVAREAMAWLAPLAEVRLVGPVLEGTALASTPITLHLLGVTGEEVAIHLVERRVAFRERTRRVSYGPRDQRAVPTFEIRRDECKLELLAFGPDAPRQAPLSAVTGRAERRATPAALDALLEA